MSEFKIKEGSNRPWYVAVLREPERDEFGAVINPDNPTMIPINFKEQEIEAVFLILRDAQKADPDAPMLKEEMELLGTKEAGLVRYKFKVEDTTDKAGQKNVEYEFIYKNSETSTIPEDSYGSMTIKEDLD